MDTPQNEELKTEHPNTDTAPQKLTVTTRDKLLALCKSKKLPLGVGAVVVLLVVVGAVALATNQSDPTKLASNTGSSAKGPLDASTGYTGIKADVLTNQTFDCAPRNDHEWYRTDRTLVIDPKDPNTIYVHVEWKGTFKTTDGGKTWKQITKGVKVYARSDDKTKGCYGEYPVLRMDPANNKHLILGVSGGGGGFLDATTPNSQTGGAYQTFDGGTTWQLMINNKMNLYVTDLAIDPNNTKTYYYGTTSNPASWQEADQTKLFVTKGLIYRTTDGGKNWTELPTGIGSHSGAVRVLVNPKNSKEIVAPTYSATRQSADGTGTGVATGKDTSVAQMGILRSSDGGASWTKTQLPGSPAISAGFSAPTNFNHMFFIPQTQNAGVPNVYVSLDGAQTFSASGQYMDIVAYDPYDTGGNHMFGYSTIAGTPTVPSLNLFESNDAGLTWHPHGTLPKEITDLNAAETRPSMIAWSPSDTKTIYMSGGGGHIWKSTDLGASWTTLLTYKMLP